MHAEEQADRLPSGKARRRPTGFASPQNNAARSHGGMDQAILTVVAFANATFIRRDSLLEGVDTFPQKPLDLASVPASESSMKPPRGKPRGIQQP